VSVRAGNGHELKDVEVVPPPQVTITLKDYVNWRLEIGGSVPNYDVMLNMLLQATREVEGLLRMEKLTQYQQSAHADARAAAVVRDMLRKR